MYLKLSHSNVYFMNLKDTKEIQKHLYVILPFAKEKSTAVD